MVGQVLLFISRLLKAARFFLIIPQLAKGAGATEELKAADSMQWVGLMNTCKAQAEEIVKFELIYV